MRIKTAAVAAMTVLSIVLVIGCTSVGDYARRYEARQAGVDPDQLKSLQDEAQSERAECDQGSQTACIAYQNSLGEIRDWHNNYAAGKRAEASSQQRPVQTNCIRHRLVSQLSVILIRPSWAPTEPVTVQMPESGKSERGIAAFTSRQR